MARTLQVTDGTTTVNLLNLSSGFQLARDGWQPAFPEQTQIWRESAFSEGRGLIASRAQNVIETLRASLSASSHDNAASQLQDLAKLARRAREYHTTAWQTTPVYLQAQTTGETNARYALVYDIQLQTGNSLYGPPFDPGDFIASLDVFIERESYWRDTAPGNLPASALTLTHPDFPDGTGTLLPVTNYRDAFALTHVYSYDDSATTFSGNLIASSTFNYYEVSGSTPAANDIVYFGSAAGEFKNVVLTLGTLLSATGYTYAWEYWNGSAWSAMSNVDDLSNGLQGQTDMPTGVTMYVIMWEAASDWVSTTINGIAAFWWRIRITAVTTWTTSPAQATRVPFNVKTPYVELGAAQIDGDVNALIRWLLYSTLGKPGVSSINTFGTTLIAGLKSVGLTNFVSHLNAGGTGNPAIWSITNGTDTSTTSDPLAPGGDRATCTFATTAAWATRLVFYITNDTAAGDYVGEYECYLRCQQIGGNDGDVWVRLRASTDEPVESAAVAYTILDGVQLTDVGNGPETVHLGRVVIPPGGANQRNTMIDLELGIDAKSDNGITPDLYIYDLVLIPIDEAILAAVDGYALDGGSFASLASNAGIKVLESDAGLVERRAAIIRFEPSHSDAETLLALWQHRSAAFLLPPDKQLRIYILIISIGIGGNSNKRAYLPFTVLSQMYAHERWSLLRGTA